MGRRKRRDTSITDEEKLFSLIYGHNFVRSKKARDVDNATTRGVTDSFAKMWTDPSRHDWPNVDTVVRNTPRNFTKEKGRRAFKNVEDLLGDSGF